jgi:hypothetical protein
MSQHNFILLSALRQVHDFLPKRVLHTVRSSASSFSIQYTLSPLSASSSCLPLLPRLTITSILCSLFQSRVLESSSQARRDQSNYLHAKKIQIKFA